MCEENKRYIWVDVVKVIACILVVLGHFFQSMVKSGVFSESFGCNWFIDTIYRFHVQLFFICSGFLYQKYTKVDSYKAYSLNVLKKLIALGIPYFFFSTATWLLKKIFSSSVNVQVEGFGESLFWHPIPPYWYLFVLFFLFVITPTTKNVKKQIILCIIAAFLRIMNDIGFFSSISNIYLVNMLFSNWVWFVIGMLLAYNLIKFNKLVISMMVFIIFLLGSTLVEKGYSFGNLTGFLLSSLACYSIISIVYNYTENYEQSKCVRFMSRYTMPVFLMHTLFAAPVRSILIKLGISNPIFHTVIGLVASFGGPIVAMIIMEKLKPLDFIVYPTRYIKIRKRSTNND